MKGTFTIVTAQTMLPKGCEAGKACNQIKQTSPTAQKGYPRSWSRGIVVSWTARRALIGRSQVGRV